MNAGLSKLESQGFCYDGSGSPSAFTILFMSHPDKDQKAVIIYSGIKEARIIPGEMIGAGLEVREPMIAIVRKEKTPAKRHFSSLYEYTCNAPNPDILPPASRQSVFEKLKGAFHSASFPLVGGEVESFEISGIFRNHVNVQLSDGHIVKCSRNFVRGLENEDTENMLVECVYRGRKQNIEGIVSPFKNEDGSQRLLFGWTYRTNSSPSAPQQ
ncbi:MAG TPA: hypothetical protein VIF12_02000 [Micavibrio sp.]